ncbi:hypothetical protein MLD38_018474 [Melastoma candidum]|uniref:Uncharacterized protein n=1 Tax=Melastoma candidum TaxID=119954 RepID=A0ACB9QTD4_9MYRT|nr:hypothetical protein MLD38_018474 [Melastoma candidum]
MASAIFASMNFPASPTTLAKLTNTGHPATRAMLSYPCSVKKMVVASSARGQVGKASDEDVDYSLRPVSPGECVRKLYYSINTKDEEDHCRRLQEIMAFLEQLTTAMGKNVKFFYLQEFHEDGDAAWASWHLGFLESPQVVIPFVQRIYLMFLVPFIKPLLSSYINIGKFVVHAIGSILSVLKVFLKLLFN